MENKVKDESMLIRYDFEGWPLYKQTIRDMLMGLGLNYNQETNKWEISEDDPRLDIIPRTLEDDGMGYGVNEKFISSCDMIQDEEDNYYCNIFIDEQEK